MGLAIHARGGVCSVACSAVVELALPLPAAAGELHDVVHVAVQQLGCRDVQGKYALPRRHPARVRGERVVWDWQGSN